MEGQSKEVSKGGSMRLGAYDCSIEKGTLAHKIYGKDDISERHRQRLEVNNKYVETLNEKGMIFSAFLQLFKRK